MFSSASDEKSVVIFIFVSLYVMWDFFLAAFMVFIFLWCSAVSLWCPEVCVSQILVLLWNHWPSWIYKFKSFTKFGEFLVMMSSSCFFFFFFLLPPFFLFPGSTYSYVRFFFYIALRSLGLFFFFQSFLFVFFKFGHSYWYVLKFITLLLSSITDTAWKNVISQGLGRWSI